MNNSWGVKRPDNFKNNDDWDRLIHFVNSQRPDNYVSYKGEADQYYGINRNNIGYTSPYKEDFEKIVTLSEATQYIFENSQYIGASGGELDDFDVKLPNYEIGDITDI